jgi:hypothetical protein
MTAYVPFGIQGSRGDTPQAAPDPDVPGSSEKCCPDLKVPAVTATEGGEIDDCQATVLQVPNHGNVQWVSVRRSQARGITVLYCDET